MFRKVFALFIFTLIAGGIVADPSQATTYNFQPNPVNMNNLTHQEYYLWKINWSMPMGEHFTGATLLFKNINDWTNETGDRLFTHLLDDPNTSGWTSVSPGLPKNLWKKIDNEGGGDNFFGQGIKIGEYTDNNSAPEDLIYNFDGSQIATLTSYVANGFFGFGIDPDCHYFNDYIKFTVTTCPGQIPEPATMFLLGSGLIGVAGLARRKLKK